MREVNYWRNLIYARIISAFSCLCIYPNAESKISFQKINDFYVGYSLFMDHNKILDISMFFIYLALTFLLFLLINKANNYKNNKEKTTSDAIDLPVLKCTDALKSVKKFLLKFQFFGIFGYLLLHPYDGHFYPPVALIIFAFMTIAVFDYKKRGGNSFSPLCIAPFFLLFIFKGYNNLAVPVDDHHLGEKFSVYFMHAKYNLQYYKDIMLVHGFCDILPSCIGDHLFNMFNMQGFLYGMVFERNFTALLALIVIGYAFSSPIFLTLPLIAFNLENELHTAYIVQTCLILSSFLLLLKDKIFEKPFLVAALYIILGFIFGNYYTTIGSFWVIGGFPLFAYMIFKIFKADDKQKFLKFCVLTLIFTFLIIFNFDLIRNYYVQAQPYIKGNLIAFSNTFANMKNYEPLYIINDLLVYMTKYFTLLIIPFFIFDLFRYKKDDKLNPCNIKKTLAQKNLFLLFAIIVSFVSLSYTLGRIDFAEALRLCRISITYLIVFLPYFLIGKIDFKTIKILCLIAFVSGIVYNKTNITNTLSNICFKPIPQKTILNTSDNVTFDRQELARLETAKKFTDKYSDSGDYFLDLNNRGMHYFYFDRKIPILFVSFYNSISSFQDKESLKRLKENPPKFILICSNPVFHDELKVSLRMNQVYKWILTSGLYSLKEEKGQYGLALDKNHSKYTKEELKILDDLFGPSNIGYIPDIWGKSIKNLAAKEVDFKYNLKQSEGKIYIIFDKPIKGSDFDLLYIDTKNKKGGICKIKIKSSDFKMRFNTKTGKTLVPINSVPSWLLENEIKEMQITYDYKPNIKNIEIKFYKRN